MNKGLLLKGKISRIIAILKIMQYKNWQEVGKEVKNERNDL